ncbi:Uma2 family endonuclease [Roseomonas sp. CCTCC AB2023176]|uniref:Uma2 family endonuclease n=1 Tax=Roseomonas sp. CCTCC AB2023176 TaxID=3342640 RepID=UPI0035D7F410
MGGDRPGLLERETGLRRHKLDVAAYYRMAEVGILGPDDRVELIEGEILDMAPIGSAHGATVDSLAEAVRAGLARRAIVRVQGPLRLSGESELQPDLMLLRPREDRYRGSHPGPGDVLLLVEVADSTLRTDRTVELPLFASQGIAEVWIVSLPEGIVEVHRGPQGEAWRSTLRMGRGEVLEPEALPGLRIAVDDVLG